MKNIIQYYPKLIIIVVCTCFAGCGEDFLNVIPKDQMTSETIFANETNAELFLNDIYKNMPDPDAPFGYNYDAWENWSDNSTCKFRWAMSWVLSVSRSYGPTNYKSGLYNHDYPGMPFIYDIVFKHVRKCNLFIKEVTERKANFSEEWVEHRIAEARFIRAFLYHYMWMAYGGIPIVTEVLNLGEQGDGIFKPRATAEETYRFIIRELEEIAPSLKNEVGAGRATQGAVYALKGWCELFAHEYAAAAESYRKIIEDLNVYELYQNGYNNLFLTEANGNKEAIFVYLHVQSKNKSYRSMGFGPYTPTSRTWYCMQPTQNLVDDYVMDNGLPIADPSSGYNPDSPYVGRENRFYESIVYHGSTWHGYTFDMCRKKPRRGQQSSTNRGEPSDFGINAAKEIQTGYFRRKGIDERLENFTELDNMDGAHYMYFRYAAVLLGYAEAKAELGEIDDKVINAIDQVRIRGKIPALEQTYGKSTFSKEELIPIIRRERRIELAFENIRYWDLIRWRTAEVILNQPKYGCDIYWDETILNPYTGTKGKLEFDTRYLVHNCEFNPAKHYWFPFYQNWINGNPEIQKQNGGADGWVNGQNPGY